MKDLLWWSELLEFTAIPPALQAMILPLLLLLFTTFLLITIKRGRATLKTKLRPPPSPRKLPILGNLHQVGKYPHRTFATMSEQLGRAHFLLFHFGSKPVVVVSTSEAAREMMKTHDLISADKPALKSSDKLLYGGKDIAAARYGEYWRQTRRLCVLHLLSNKKVASCSSVREEEIGLLVNRIADRAVAGEAVNLSELLSGFANDVVCRISLGRKFNNGSNFGDLFKEFMTVLAAFNVGEFIPWLSWVNRVTGYDARVERVAREFDELLDRAVAEGRARLPQATLQSETAPTIVVPLIDILLHFQDSPDEFPLDGDGIKAVILDMFVAGTDTSSTLMEWTMAELLKHPGAMKKLQEEVRREVGNGAANRRVLSEADLDRLPYLKLVIKETIRLHPPIPLLSPRRMMQDATMMGYDIPAGAMVLTNAWAIGRDPADWPESPNEFWPERFLNTSVDFRGQDFQFIPFGSGRRSCPGVSFAMAVVELALANLVYGFDWKLPGGVQGSDLDMSECAGLTAHRQLPLFALPTVYHRPHP